VKPDPIDQLGARLFEAARSEAIPDGAERRALAALRRANEQRTTGTQVSAQRKWLVGGVGVAIAIAASIALLMRSKENTLAISAEPSRSAHTEPGRRELPRTEAPIDAAPAVPSLMVAPKPAPSAGPPALQSPPVTLSDELSALKVASSALGAGDTEAALSALDRYDHVLKGKKMRAEATLLRIEALSRAGQAEAASALAQRFVKQNPGNPLVDRARSFVHE